MPEKGEELYKILKADPNYEGVGSDYNKFKTFFSDEKNYTKLYNTLKADPNYEGIGKDVNAFSEYFGLKKKDLQGFSQELPKPAMPSGKKFTQGIGLGVKPISSTVPPLASKQPKSTTPLESTGEKESKQGAYGIGKMLNVQSMPSEKPAFMEDLRQRAELDDKILNDPTFTLLSSQVGDKNETKRVKLFEEKNKAIASERGYKDVKELYSDMDEYLADFLGEREKEEYIGKRDRVELLKQINQAKAAGLPTEELQKTYDEQVAQFSKAKADLVINADQEIRNLRRELEGADPEDKADILSQIDGLEASKKDFFKPKTQDAKTIVEAEGLKEGTTDQEKVQIYAHALMRERSDLRESLGITKDRDAMIAYYTTAGADNPYWKRLQDVEDKLESVAPVVLINETPITGTESAWSVFGKVFKENLIPAATDKGTEQEIAGNLIRGLELAGVDVKSIQEDAYKTLDKTSKPYEDWSSKDLALMAAPTLAIMPKFVIATLATEGLGSFAAVSPYWRGIKILSQRGSLGTAAAEGSLLKVIQANKYGRGLLQAGFKGLEYGTQSQVETMIFAADKGEMGFVNGLVGGSLGVGAEKLTTLAGKGVAKALTSIFGNKAPDATGKILAAAKKAYTYTKEQNTKALGEVGEELGEDLGGMWMESENGEEFFDKINEHYGTPSKALKFFLSTYMMGYGIGTAGELGSAAFSSAGKMYKNLSAKDRAIADNVISDLRQEQNSADVDAGIDLVNNSKLTDEEKAKAEEQITAQGEAVNGVIEGNLTTEELKDVVSSLDEKEQPQEEIESKISVGGLKGGYTVSQKTRASITKDSVQYKQNFDPRETDGTNSKEAFAKKIDRNGKTYRVVGVKINRPNDEIGRDTEGRQGMAYAMIEDDGNLPNNIDEFLVKKAIEEGKNLYPDLKLSDSDFILPITPTAEQTMLEKEQVPEKLTNEYLLKTLPKEKNEGNTGKVMITTDKFGGTKTRYIPFEIIEQANKNDKLGGQTAKEINDRGGYSDRELDKLYPNWRDDIKETPQAVLAESTPSENKDALKDVESTAKALENKLPDAYQANTRNQSTKDLIKWAEDIFDTKFEGDFEKGEYVSWFQSLGNEGYEAASLLNTPKKALLKLKESPTYKAKSESLLSKEQTPKVKEQAVDAEKTDKKPAYIEQTEGGRNIITRDNVKNNFPIFYERVVKKFSNSAWDSSDIRDAISYLISNKPTYKNGMNQLISAQIEAEKLLSELGQEADFITRKELLEKIRKNENYSTEQKDVFEGIINRLKGDKFFDFTNKNIDSDNGYQFSNNLLKAKDADAFIHEVGHWGFYNLLSSEQRTKYLEYVRDRFYGTENKMSDDLAIKRKNEILDKILESNSEDNFSEYFAEQFRQYIIDGIAPKEVKSIFENFKEYLFEIVKLFKEKGYNKDLKPFFDTIIETNKQQEDAIKTKDEVSSRDTGSRTDNTGAEVGDTASVTDKGESGKEAVSEAEVESVAKTAGVTPKNIRDLYNIGRDLFALNRVQALAQAVVMDKMIGAMAKRKGVKKSEIYKTIQFKKASEKDLPQEALKQTKEEILRVFHGTSKDKDFKKFKDTGKGIFVTISPKDASEYAEQNDSMKFGDYDPVTGKFKEINTASRVIPMNLKLGNVYKLSKEDLAFLNSKPNYSALQKQLHAQIKAQGFDTIDYGNGVYAVITEGRLNSMLTNEVLFQKDLPQGVKMQLDAWHASPYLFDKFSSLHQGKGVGASRSGVGLYFAIDKKRAEGYAEKFSDNTLKIGDIEIKEKGAIYPTDFYQNLKKAFDKSNGNRITFAKELLKIANEKRIEGFREKENFISISLKNGRLTEQQVEDYDFELPIYVEQYFMESSDYRKFARNALKTGVEQNKIPSYLYTVTIKENGNWLDFNKKMTDEQYDAIVNQAKKENSLYLPYILEQGKNKNNRDFYWNVGKSVSQNEKELSNLLMRAGIDGNIGLEDADMVEYVLFDENAISIEEVIKFQKDAIKARGAMMMNMDGQAVIYALSDPNVSTPLHELAHVFEHYLTESEKNEVVKAAGTKGWTIETSEYFARGFEKYLADGKAPSKGLQKLFDKFKEWLTEIYNGITDSNIDVELNEKMEDIYSQMLGVSVKKKTQKFPKNVLDIAKETGLSPQEVQNTYKKYDGTKSIEEITIDDYNNARAAGNEQKLENSKKAFEALLKADSDSPTAKKKADKLKEEVSKETLKGASDIMGNIDEIRKQLLDAGVIKSINCKWGK